MNLQDILDTLPEVQKQAILSHIQQVELEARIDELRAFGHS